MPVDYLPCNGQSVGAQSFPELFDVLGYFYGGSGDSFSLPNYQNRVVAHLGTSANFDTHGRTVGVESHTLTAAQMPAHTHVQNQHTHTFTGTAMGNHNHIQNAHNHARNATLPRLGSTRAGLTPSVASGSGFGLEWIDFPVTANATPTNVAASAGTPAGTNANTTPTNNNTGGGGAHNNIQPTITQIYAIKAR